MSEQKLTPVDIASGLSRRASVPLRYSEDFVRSFFRAIEEGLVHDNVVKVKGFGTFKTVSVDPRESIDVNTGARIEIAGHAKVSFTPDAALRDAVNKPFLEFETVILDEATDTAAMESLDEIPVAVVAEPAAEIPAVEKPVAEPAAEKPAAEPAPVKAVAEPAAEKPAAEKPAIEKPVAEKPAAEKPAAEIPAVEKPVVEKPAAEKPAAEPAPPKPAEKKTAAALVADKPAATTSTTAPVAEKKTAGAQSGKSTAHAVCYILTALLFMLIGYIIAYYWRPVELPDFSVKESQEQVIPAEEEPVPVTPAVEAQPAKPTIPAETRDYPQVEGGEYWIVGVEGTEVMRPGKTLLNFSLQYYKSKDFVNYICTMNDIKNPDIVPLDMELKMPKLLKKEQ